MRILAIIAVLTVICGCASMPADHYFVGDWRGGGEAMHKVLSFIDSQKHKLKCIKISDYSSLGFPADEAEEDETEAQCFELVMGPDSNEGVRYHIETVLEELLHNNQYAYWYVEDKDGAFLYDPNTMDSNAFFCKMEFEDFTVWVGTARMNGGLVLQTSGKCPVDVPALEVCQFRNPRFILALLKLTQRAVYYQIFMSDLLDNMYENQEFDAEGVNDAEGVIRVLGIVACIPALLPASDDVIVEPVSREEDIRGWEDALLDGMCTKERLSKDAK
jgi:hypothetical protein